MLSRLPGLILPGLSLAALLVVGVLALRSDSSGRRPRFIRDHWYRGAGGSCQLTGCARPRWEHRQAIGEWRFPPHWFVPECRRPAWCRRCARTLGHTVHHLTPARLGMLWRRP